MKIRRSGVAGTLSLTAELGLAALVAGAQTQAAPPCPYPPPFQCLDYYDPVECLKPGVGWRVYGNACYAAQDCAKHCRAI